MSGSGKKGVSYKSKYIEARKDIENLESRNGELVIERDKLIAEKKREQEAKNKRYSKAVYCENCQEVHSVSIPPGVSIKEGDCINCRVRGKLHLVSNLS